tara:strand:+ start:6953 stop:7765 length:813 start_codon:yes stop_codon:yes gene_type:complete
MKRTVATAAIPADLLLTQADEFIIAENGWLVLANQSDSDTIKPDDIYHILTEDGDLLQAQDNRFLGTQQEVIVINANDFILAENLDQLTAENGWLFLSNESNIPTTKPDIASFFRTEDGQNILLTQDYDIFTTQQYRESGGEFFGDRDILTQDGEALYTQDGRSIQEDTPFIFNLLLTQDGDVLSTQEGQDLTLQQNELVIAAQAKLISQYGIELRTQDGNDFLTNQIITTSAFEPPYELEKKNLLTQDANTLTTENGDVIMLQDVYIAA